MIEFDVDMGYLLECDELDKVVLNDESGEHEPMEFAPIAATVGARDYTYDEWRAISEAVGDAMEYAHEHAVMYPDKADPLWNIDEYVNRVLEVAYGTRDATVCRRDTMGLWHEWEQVLFANVSDEVAQDNLNECVHELLDKAATMGEGTCHNISKVTDTRGRKVRFVCSECDAWIDSEFIWNHEYSNGESPWVKDCKLNYCPNCGRRCVG